MRKLDKKEGFRLAQLLSAFTANSYGYNAVNHSITEYRITTVVHDERGTTLGESLPLLVDELSHVVDMTEHLIEITKEFLDSLGEKEADCVDEAKGE